MDMLKEVVMIMRHDSKGEVISMDTKHGIRGKEVVKATTSSI